MFKLYFLLQSYTRKPTLALVITIARSIDFQPKIIYYFFDGKLIMFESIFVKKKIFANTENCNSNGR